MYKLIIGSLIVCCVVLETGSGSVFARKLGDEGNRDVYLESEYYNTVVHGSKNEFKNVDSTTGIEGKKVDVAGSSGDYLQGLIMAPVAIVKTIGDNPAIMSK